MPSFTIQLRDARKIPGNVVLFDFRSTTGRKWQVELANPQYAKDWAGDWSVSSDNVKLLEDLGAMYGVSRIAVAQPNMGNLPNFNGRTLTMTVELSNG